MHGLCIQVAEGMPRSSCADVGIVAVEASSAPSSSWGDVERSTIGAGFESLELGERERGCCYKLARRAFLLEGLL